MDPYLKANGKLDRDLVSIRDNVLRLSYMADQEIDHAVKALRNRDIDMARDVIVQDAKINEFRYRIEQDCYRILAMQQPTARDMRALMTAIHIAVELERIADHAVGIAKITLEILKHPTIKPPDELQRMEQIAREMLRTSLDAYMNWDHLLAQQTSLRDHEVDTLDKKIFQQILDCMNKDPQKINGGTYLLWNSHNLERIADRITNICERVVFMVTGEITVEQEG